MCLDCDRVRGSVGNVHSCIQIIVPLHQINGHIYSKGQNYRKKLWNILYQNNMESVFVLRLASIGVSGQFELGQGLRQGFYWMVNIMSEKKNFKIIIKQLKKNF